MELKPWEYQMNSVMRECMKKNKFDAVTLFAELEKVSQKFFSREEMQDGDCFIIPTENGAYLKQFFYKNYSTMLLIRPNKQERYIISEEDYHNKQYDYLVAYMMMTEDAGLGIGPEYPAEFIEILENIKQGQVITFNNGCSFFCRLTNGKDVGLTQVSRKTKMPDLSAFDERKEDMIHTHYKLSVQLFYAQVKDEDDDSVKFRVTTMDEIEELYIEMCQGITRKKQSIQLGSNKVNAKRKIFTNKVKWFDDNGILISEDKIKAILGWMATAPNKE